MKKRILKKGKKIVEEKIEIKLSQLLSSLSYALDIAENRYYGHSRRTAYVAYSISREMGLGKEDIMDIYYASFIHDIGMAGHMSNYSIMDIHSQKNLMKEHCSFGYDILGKIPLKEEIKKYVLYHHEEWNGSGPFGLKGYEIPLGSQIIHIADYFELFFVRKMDSGTDTYDMDIFKKWLKDCKNTMFNEDISHILMELMNREKFWLDLQWRNMNSTLSLIELEFDTTIDIHKLSNISEVFSTLIDGKSEFTYEHSLGVSTYANKFAKYLAYDPLMVEKLTIAANLHDIGKFIIPLDILEKPKKLSSEEFLIMKSHAYYTKLILKQIEGLEDIAEWAGNHHEKLNGNGYPEGLDENSLTKEDQIIAFADIYQALIEDRPYRQGMPPKKAIRIMENMANKGYICNDMLGDFKQLVL